MKFSVVKVHGFFVVIKLWFYFFYLSPLPIPPINAHIPSGDELHGMCSKLPLNNALVFRTNDSIYVFRASEDAFLKECDDNSPGTEWEKVARLCDFNPKTSRQTKDVSRMRSVLISLKQTPLSR